MKVLILGGGGMEGRTVARDLANSGVKKLILADYNLEAADSVAETLRKECDAKVKTVFVDANDYDALVKVIKEADAKVAVNMIGPFFKYGVQIAKASIEAKVNHVDICDDSDPANEVLDTLNEAAKAAGVTVLVGCGATPGLSNMLSKYGAMQLDKTDKINIDWLWPGLTGGGVAALTHGFKMYSGTCPQYIDGKVQQLPAGTENVKVKSSDGKYEGIVHYVGHGEPATLPRYIDANEITCMGGLMPEEVDKYFFNFMKAGLADTTPMEVQGNMISLPHVAMGILIREFSDMEMENPEDGYCRIKIVGTKDNKEQKFVYEVSGNGSHMTSYPTSVVTQMILNGEINMPGTHAPEALKKEQLEKVFSEVQKRGVEIKGL